MRYTINFAKTINQLVPHYIGGRKLILYLQALVRPLQILNDEFSNYAKETRIEASMTSQIIKFEWYLNRKFQSYFLNGGKITIRNSASSGVPIYNESADIPVADNIVLYESSEHGVKTVALYHQNESTLSNSTSFIVSSPAIDATLISQDQYIAMLSYYIDKYRLSNKTYIIKINA